MKQFSVYHPMPMTLVISCESCFRHTCSSVYIYQDWASRTLVADWFIYRTDLSLCCFRLLWGFSLLLDQLKCVRRFWLILDLERTPLLISLLWTIHCYPSVSNHRREKLLMSLFWPMMPLITNAKGCVWLVRFRHSSTLGTKTKRG